MKEISVIGLLERQREKNEKAYHQLFGSLNLSPLSNFSSLPQTNASSYQTLMNAGFEPESLIDKLTISRLKILLHLTQQDISGIYLEQDIEKIAKRYGLKMIHSFQYMGSQKTQFSADLEAFQLNLKEIDLGKFYDLADFKTDYHLLGTSGILSGYKISKQKPLILFNIGQGICYLISKDDTWINPLSRIIYQPWATPLSTGMVGNLLLLFMVILLPNPILPLFLYLVWFIYYTIGFLDSNWKYLNSFPNWMARVICKILP